MPLQLKINDDFVIESDGRNYILKYRFYRNSRTNPGEKNEYWGELYFGKIEHVFDELLDRTLKVQEIGELDEIRNLVLELRRDIIQTINSAGFSSYMRERDIQHPSRLEEPVESAKVVAGIKRRGVPKPRKKK